MEPFMINFELLSTYSNDFLQGTLLTLKIASFGCLIGITGGIVLGLIQAQIKGPLAWLVTIYTTIIRGTPMLIQIAFIYFLLPELGFRFSEIWSAIIAIGLNSSAYVSQIIRSGVNAVSVGQREAAHVLGLNHMQTIRFIILPQAIRTVLPALGNELITLVKETSLASTIGVMELSKTGIFCTSRTFDAIGVYGIVAAIYLVITSILTLLVYYLEQRMNRNVTRS
jgi:polar amino acid transport system permease protein